MFTALYMLDGTLDGTLILCISIQSECDAFAVIFTSYSAYVVIISMWYVYIIFASNEQFMRQEISVDHSKNRHANQNRYKWSEIIA